MTAISVTVNDIDAAGRRNLTAFRRSLGYLRLLMFNSELMCGPRAGTRVSRAPSRDKCAFTCANVRQCAVMCANFSREAVDSKNSSFPSKTSLDTFLAFVLNDLNRAISTHLYLSLVISTDFYIRARETKPMLELFDCLATDYIY